ncbi:MAG: GDSL-type esterase/lipase family protein [Planctomycetota bacterium]
MNTTPPKPPSARRQSLRRRMGCALALLLLGLGAIAGEVLLRALAPESAYTGHGMYVADPDLSYRLLPGHEHGDVAINSHGLRDPERPQEKPAGVKRVLVLGDSFTFGSGPLDPAHGFVRGLEARLGPEVQAINSGVPGWGTVQQAAWLERDGLAWEPDALVVAFFVGNDVWENQHPATKDVLNGELIERGEPKQHSWWRVTRNKSRLYRLFKELPSHVGDAFTGDSNQARWYHRIERTRMGVCSTVDAEAWEPGWTATREALAKVKALAGSRPCVLLVIPDEFQVDPALREAVAARWDLNLADYDWELPQRRLAALAEELGYTHLDLLEELRARTAAGEEQYLPFDSHWNQHGNALAAERLAELPALANLGG